MIDYDTAVTIAMIRLFIQFSLTCKLNFRVNGYEKKLCLNTSE